MQPYYAGRQEQGYRSEDGDSALGARNGLCEPGSNPSGDRPGKAFFVRRCNSESSRMNYSGGEFGTLLQVRCYWADFRVTPFHGLPYSGSLQNGPFIFMGNVM